MSYPHNHRACLDGVHALMNKVMAEWFWLVFRFLSNRSIWPGLAHRDSLWWLPPIDDHRQGWVILPHIPLLLRHILLGLVSSDTTKAFTLWWTKSRLSDFDSYFTYYPTNMAGTCIIGLASMTSALWWSSSRLGDITSYFAYITSFSSRTCLSCNNVAPTDFGSWSDSNIDGRVTVFFSRRVSSGLPRRRSRSDGQSHGRMKLISISLIIPQMRLEPAPSDSSRWLPSIDDHRHIWEVLLLFLLYCVIS